ncbi:hypothetical protein AVL61_05020 [Kocuria rosea subsp. polaris]|uniref:Uncharacterized protein n=2 Tax=Kocuria rosea TaxID=1275 RepID=A0A0W8I7X4_KOCRO|nr:hypothetical protein AVL61_05020 [Kocuria polaris]
MTFPTPVLAAHLADKWVEVSREVPGSSSELATGVRLFLRHLGQRLHQAECLAGFGLYDIRRRHLDSWEQELRDRRQRSHTDTPYRYAVHFFALLDRIECDVPGLLHPEVVRRIEQGTRLTHLRNPGLPAYGSREVRRMRFRAHHVIYQAIQNESPQGADRQTLVALSLLLSLATGEPIEVLRQLTIGKVLATASSGHDEATRDMTHSQRLSYLAQQDAVDAYALTYTKERAGGETHGNVYTRRDRDAHRALTALLRLTATIRSRADTDTLWICIRADGTVQEPPWSQTVWSLRRWTKDHGIGVAEPVIWNRFRKVVVAEEALEQGGSYLRRTVRHSPDVFIRHYTTSAVLRKKAGRLLMDAISEYFTTAVAGPLVVTPEAQNLLAAGQQTSTLPGDLGAKLLNGDLDGPHTACRDPLDSPYQEAGEICRLSTTGTCFGCPNALITQDHLPAALLIAEIADPARSADPRAWLERWKHIHEVLTQIVLPAFSADAIEAARTKVGTVPLNIGTANDMRGPGDE